jgi:hypothetical protein
MATQRTQIYLEGVALDLDKNVDIDFTYSIADIADFEKRTTTYSKTINIPATAHNNFLLGNYFDFNINNEYSPLDNNVGVNFNPMKKAFVKVVVDNVEVFAGVLRLLEITSKDGAIEYQCALFGSLGGLFSTLGEKLLTDLPLTDWGHSYNIDTIEDSWAGTFDYVYPLANYGVAIDENLDRYDVKNFRPAVFLKSLFDKILDDAGYTYNESFWFSNNLDKLILLNNEDAFSIFIELFAHLTIYDFTAQGYPAGPVGGGSSEFPLIASTYSATYITLDAVEDSFAFVNMKDADVSAKVRISFDFESTLNIYSAPFFRTRTGNRLIYPTDSTYFDTSISSSVISPDGNPVSGSITMEWNIQIKKDDKVYISFQVPDNAFIFGDIQISNMVFDVLPLDALVKLPADYSAFINGKSIVPTNVKQSDFIKSVINLLNLYIIQDKDNEFNLTFTPYPDFYSSDENDWSAKKDLNSGFSIKSSNDFVPRNYIMNYKNDVDYYSKRYLSKYGTGYGNLKFASGNEFSKEDKTIELLFSLCPLISNTSNNMILSAMHDINPDGSYKQVKTNPKLAFWGGLKSTTSYNIMNANTILLTTTSYPYAGHVKDPIVAEDGSLYDLCFATPNEIYFSITSYPLKNIYKTYYEGFILSQNNKDTKLITLYFLLNSIDIMNIDFRKYIKLDNGIYYLNKIDGYNPLGNELTKVELLRIV